MLNDVKSKYILLHNVQIFEIKSIHTDLLGHPVPTWPFWVHVLVVLVFCKHGCKQKKSIKLNLSRWKLRVLMCWCSVNMAAIEKNNWRTWGGGNYSDLCLMNLEWSSTQPWKKDIKKKKMDYCRQLSLYTLGITSQYNSYPHKITTAVRCLLFSFCTWRSFDPKVMWLREIVWIRGFLQFACPPF